MLRSSVRKTNSDSVATKAIDQASLSNLSFQEDLSSDCEQLRLDTEQNNFGGYFPEVNIFDDFEPVEGRLHSSSFNTTSYIQSPGYGEHGEQSADLRQAPNLQGQSQADSVLISQNEAHNGIDPLRNIFNCYEQSWVPDFFGINEVYSATCRPVNDGTVQSYDGDFSNDDLYDANQDRTVSHDVSWQNRDVEDQNPPASPADRILETETLQDCKADLFNNFPIANPTTTNYTDENAIGDDHVHYFLDTRSFDSNVLPLLQSCSNGNNSHSNFDPSGTEHLVGEEEFLENPHVTDSHTHSAEPRTLIADPVFMNKTQGKTSIDEERRITKHLPDFGSVTPSAGPVPQAGERHSQIVSDSTTRQRARSNQIKAAKVTILTEGLGADGTRCVTSEVVEAFICDICSRRHATEESLQAHKRRQHNAEGSRTVFTCPHCHLELANKTNLSRHLKGVHGPNATHECNLCKVKFSSKKTLAVHREKLHNIIPDTYKSRRRRYTNPCTPDLRPKPTVAKKNNTSSSWNIGEKAIDASEEDDVPLLQKRVFKCSFCELVSQHRGNVKRHENIVHKGIKEFECRACLKKFGTKDNLKLHKCQNTQSNQ